MGTRSFNVCLVPLAEGFWQLRAQAGVCLCPAKMQPPWLGSLLVMDPKKLENPCFGRQDGELRSSERRALRN